MKIRFTLTQPLLLILVSFCCVTRTFACTCGDLMIAEQRNNATVVFIGTAIKKIRSDAVKANGVQVIFKVRRVWKGDVSKEVAVYTGATGDLYAFEDLCAPLFKVGKAYVVFALGSGKLETDVCTGTVLARYATGTIRELGKSYRPKNRVIRSRSQL